ncbi:MAG: hypothetical protein PHX21_12555 [bacterium]|nr:hypothetical protein [bacterium]
MVLLFCIAMLNPVVMSECIKPTKEKTICAKIELSSIKLILKKAETDTYIINTKLNYDSTNTPVAIDYKIESKTGQFNIKEDNKQSNLPTGEDGGDILETLNKLKNICTVMLSPKIPLELNLNVKSADMGHPATAVINLTGLKVSGFNFSTNGISTVCIDSPNTVSCKDFCINSQFGSFKGTNLGNANFENCYFSGGVGLYTLDFNGSFEGSKRIEIAIGTGQLNLILPDSVSIKLKSKGVHLKNIKKLAKDENGWYCSTIKNSKKEHPATAVKELIIHIDGSMGIATIR